MEYNINSFEDYSNNEYNGLNDDDIRDILLQEENGNFNKKTKDIKFDQKAKVKEEFTCLNAFNEYFFKEFNNLSESAKYRDPNNKMSLVYKKVCSSIKKYPFPIVSSSNYNRLVGVGNTISNKFETLLEKYKEYIKDNNINARELMTKINKKLVSKLNKETKKRWEILQTKRNLISTEEMDNKNSKSIVVFKQSKLMNNESNSKKTNISSSVQSKEAMREELKKKKQLISHIEPYTGLWTALIASYLATLQENTLTVKIEDIIKNSENLVAQFSEIIKLTTPTLEDIFSIKTHEFLDKTVKLKHPDNCKTNTFELQIVCFKQSLVNFCKTELEKSGIIISNFGEEVSISLSEDFENAINNRKKAIKTECNNLDSLSIINNCNSNNYSTLTNFKDMSNNIESNNHNKIDINKSYTQSEMFNKYKSQLNIIDESNYDYPISFNNNSTSTFYSQRNSNSIMEEKDEIKDSGKSNKFKQTYLDSNLIGNSDIEKAFNDFLAPSQQINQDSENIFLVIDNRELEHHGKPVHEFINLMNKLGYGKAKNATINLGDILWTVVDKETKEEYVLDYIVERKTLDDLAHSIIDGRYKEQKCRLKNSQISNLYYLIENLKFDTKHSSISMSTLETAMLNIMNVHDINIIRTETLKQSIDFLEEMDVNVRKMFKKQVKQFGRSDFFSRLVKYEDYNNNNQKSRNTTCQKIFYRQLRCFDSCGTKAIDSIKKWFKTPYELYTFLKKLDEDDKELIFEALNIVASREDNLYCDFLGSKNKLKDVIELIESNSKFTKEKKKYKSKKMNRNLVEQILNFYC